VQSTIVELGKLFNGLGYVGTDCQGPENPLRAELQFAALGFSAKAANVFVGCTSEKEQLVEITKAGQFGFAGRQPGILGQLARGKRAQRDDRNGRFIGDSFQGLSCRWLKLSNWYAGKAAEANRSIGSEVEVILREVDAAATFGDEGVLMTELAPGIVYLGAGSRGQPNRRNTGNIQRDAKLLEAGVNFTLGRHERVNGAVDDDGCLAHGGLQDIGRAARGQKEGGQFFCPPYRHIRPAPAGFFVVVYLPEVEALVCG
jgi:hypothetical protein